MFSFCLLFTYLHAVVIAPWRIGPLPNMLLPIDPDREELHSLVENSYFHISK
jgi:hypothetical protein